MDPSAPAPSQIDDLPLLNAVCNETIRLYPAVPATIREAVRDTELPVRTAEGDIIYRRIPQGTRVQLTPWAVNRSTRVWGKDAGEFVPERWLGEGNANTGGQASNYSLITFLHGPRSCIGQGFARSELKALVAALFGRFEVEMADPHEEVVSAGVITTKPANGVHLRMRALDGW
jgi:cytochrome P450